MIKSNAKLYGLLWFTLMLGLFQWLLWTTGYSWDSTFAQYIFPPMVGIVGIETWLRLRKQKPDALLWSLPAILAGLPAFAIGLVAIIPLLLFPIAILFVPFEWVDGEMVSKAISPDGNKQAMAYYRADFAISPDSGNNGRLTVSIKYRWLPMFRQDVKIFWMDNEERNVPLVWQGDRLIIDKEVVSVKAINWRLPSPLQDYRD